MSMNDYETTPKAQLTYAWQAAELSRLLGVGLSQGERDNLNRLAQVYFQKSACALAAARAAMAAREADETDIALALRMIRAAVDKAEGEG
jgi:hypothetical protein